MIIWYRKREQTSIMILLENTLVCIVLARVARLARSSSSFAESELLVSVLDLVKEPLDEESSVEESLLIVKISAGTTGKA